MHTERKTHKKEVNNQVNHITWLAVGGYIPQRDLCSLQLPPVGNWTSILAYTEA